MVSMKIDGNIPPDLTQHTVFLKGQYELWRYKIPYFSSVVPFDFAANNFSLIEDIPESERINWSLSELFQRDIAWERVGREIVKYLKNESRPQFFNAFTIALLPREGHGFRGDYKPGKKYQPIDDDGLEDPPIQIGGIQIQNYKGSEGIAGKIRWDKKRIIPIAVDGQHRLAAIKEFMRLVKPEVVESSSIPVIYIIPHADVGFFGVSKDESKETIVSLRQIFIDLNKNARPVSKARNILLDDQDVISVCTRILIGDQLTEDEPEGQVPLSLVDWMSEKNKIETGPFLTTVLLLNDIVSKAINVPKIKDDEEEVDIRCKYEKWLHDTFKPEDGQMEELMTQVNRCISQEVPITFEPDEITIIHELFKKHWMPIFYRFFSQLGPYKLLWDYRKTNKLMRPGFVNLYMADEMLEGEYAEKRAVSIKAALKEEDSSWLEGKDYKEPKKYIDDEIKKDEWAFKVVFQKALFLSYLDLRTTARHFNSTTQSDDELQSEFAERWIEAINKLLITDLGKFNCKFKNQMFWAGIGIKLDGTIDFSQASSTKLSKWLSVWVLLHLVEGELPTWKDLENDQRKLAGQVNKILSLDVVSKGMLKLARARSDSNKLDEELQKPTEKLIEQRYEHFSKVINKNKSTAIKAT